MKRKLLSLLLAVSVIGMCLSGCGTKKEEAVKVNPVVEESADEVKDVESEIADEDVVEDDETVESVETLDASEDADVSNIETAEENIIDETILEKPIPKTLDETVALMRSLPNGQLLSDFMFKVMGELDQVEFTDIEWTNALGEYITELETTNPTLLEEFYNAEVK